MAWTWSNIGLNSARHRLAVGAGVAFVVVMLAIGITALARQALEQMRILNTANSDNLQWTLSQTEVEFLLYYNAALHAQANPDRSLDNVRQRFDIFYSRIDTIRRGPIYGRLAVKPQMAEEFAHLDAFMLATVPFIDGDDADLRARLPAMISEAADIRADIRAISLEGIRVFSEIADQQRQSVSNTMMRIATLTVSLILLLVLALAMLARIYGTTRLQAMENKSVRERLQAMLNTSLDAVLVVDRHGRFVEFNGAATEIFGYTAQEALGQDMTKLIFADHMIEAHNAGMKRHLETGEQRVIGAGRVQVEAKRKSGEVFPVELSVAKTMAPDGEIFVSYLRDISDRIQAEKQLTKARDEALAGERAKARFMAVMSHEMRTPLNGLLGALDLLKSTPLTPKQREFSEVMQKTGALLLHHVSDVLDISRLESGKVVGERAPVDVDAMVNDVLETQSALARTKRLDLRYSPEAGRIGVMMGSAIGLRQVLLNLVSNAIKFTDTGGVEVQASLSASDKGEKRRLSLRVRDTGIGIAAADQPRIFDDFVTLDSSFGRRADGTGLGLGIARRIVQSMGGEIGVISQPGKGSTFWVDLPFDRAATSAVELSSQPPAPIALPPQKSLDILVMEDNQINRFVLREMLHAEGHRVTEAVDGLEGVAKAQTRRFDVIFTDISMPRLDGMAATLRLRAGNSPCADVPIVALTAHAMAEDRAMFLASGMNAVLNKPLDRGMLSYVLRELTLPPQRRSNAKAKPASKAAAKPKVKSAAASQRETTLQLAAKPTRKPRKAVAASAGPPLVNLSTLSELKTAFGQARLSGLTERFISEGNDTVPKAVAMLDTGDYGAAQAALHSLAGAAATFGAQALQSHLAQMEQDLKSAQFDQAAAQRPALTQLWAQTKAELSRAVTA
jgi:PAS domain S-box-containing protein